MPRVRVLHRRASQLGAAVALGAAALTFFAPAAFPAAPGRSVTPPAPAPALAAARAATTQSVSHAPTAAARPRALMPCSPPRASFSGGTGAFHSDHFLSDYVTAPTLGAGDVPNANFTNVYLWPDPASETWDAHTGGLGAPPSELIDAMTHALVCSSYFDLLTQYNINPPSFSGDETTFQSPCVNNVLNAAAANKGVIPWAAMGAFAFCIHNLNQDNNSDQINIFLSPDLKASTFLHDGTDMCSEGSDGYHGGFAGFPSWTVVDTNSSCNGGGGIGNVQRVESHEMVELISDTAAFGWKHDTVPDFNQTYNNGELGDICSSRGEYSAPSTNFPPSPNTPPGLVAPYWSDQDAQCEPQFLMNDTIVPMFSTPPFSFPGGGSPVSLVIPVNQTAGVIQALELEVATGADDLSGGAALTVTVDTKEGDHFQTGPPVNQGAQWGSNTLHAVLLDVPSGVQVSDITSITLTEPTDSWDVAGVSLQAAVVSTPPPCTAYPATVISDTTTQTLSDGTQGIKRMVGGSPQSLPETLTVPAAATNLEVTGIDLSIGTGGDNLDGGRNPQMNAAVDIHLKNGRDVMIPNVNATAEWPNGANRQVHLLSLASLPPATVAGNVQSISILTNFPGGLSGENWDISSVVASMSLGCTPSGPPPNLQDVTLLNLNPNNPLPDGHTGLCEEDSSMKTCLQSIPAVPPSEASDIVTSFQMTITTGSDDLRCCDSPGNNANVVINTTNPVGSLTFNNVNESQHLDNGVTFSFPVFSLQAPLPDPGGASPLTLGQLQSLDIQTAFGGFAPDNWDVQSVVLTATVAVGGCCGTVTPPTARATAARPLTGAASVARTARFAVGGSTTARTGERPTSPRMPSFGLASTPSHWTVKTSANQPLTDNALTSAACVTPTDCVAVGSYGSEGDSTALIETWNGATWSIAPTPSLDVAYSRFTSVSCKSASSCLAVGLSSAGGSEGGTFQPLAEAWDGSTWTLASPPASPANSVFNGVSCPAVGNCVAVGYLDVLDTAQTLVEAWSGGAWTTVPTPNQPGDNTLEGVSCWAVSKCLAVGVNGQAGLEQTLALETTGRPWTSTTPLDQDASNNALYSVSCPSASTCFAVGDYYLTTGSSSPRIRQTLVEGWNGTTWSVASSPDPDPQGDVLTSVECSARTHCTATGATFNGTTQQTLVQVWNGSTWTTATTPNPSPTANALFGGACSTTASCEVVGSSQNSSGAEQTLTIQGANARTKQVTFSNVPTAPVLTLTGTAFGAKPPASAPAGCSNTGLDYASHALYIVDLTGGWEGGVTGDCVGLVVSSYSASQIVASFGSGYNQPPTSHTLNAGDQFVITVLGSTCAGSVTSGMVTCT